MNVNEFLSQLESGELRSAIPEANGNWTVNTKVKEGILNAFKEGQNTNMNGFVDKHNIPPQDFNVERGVRLVPGGTSVRRGSYVAPGVIVMPPSYINIGAYVDEGTMVDSHVLVGSCAQIGKRVHLSAGVQIGGVLEPIGQSPVIIEDDVFLGADSVIVEGIRVRKGAVIAPGVILSKGVSIYDVVNQTILERGSDIPENAVVISGTRSIQKNDFCRENALAVSTPIIIKYRDEKSNSSLALEDALR